MPDHSKEVGYVSSINNQILTLTGLPNAKLKELIYFDNGSFALITSLYKDYVEVISLSLNNINIGDKAYRSNKSISVSLHKGLLGKSVDPLLRDIYGIDTSTDHEERYIESPILGIDKRSKVHIPFRTGVSLVDLLIPLGQGQRELVLGDRKTGKTEFLLQTMLSQVKKGHVCVYCLVGKKKDNIKKVEEFIKKHKIGDSTVVVSSTSTDTLGMIYITPYSAMTLAEYYRDAGRNVLLIIDDLTTHARFYREMSLLSKRFPGRNSYPGDIFYLHSRLLERAGNFKTNNNEDVSITCLPVAETVLSDISGYIQTNLMSITDGHIFFDNELFIQGRRPAINYFLSVTRVGRQTQSSLLWSINRELSEMMSTYENAQNFIHFGAEINDSIKAILDLGDVILAFFNQPVEKIVNINVQIFMFSMIWLQKIKEKNITKMQFLIDKISDKYEFDSKFTTFCDNLINESKDLNELLNKIKAFSTEINVYLEDIITNE